MLQFFFFYHFWCLYLIMRLNQTDRDKKKSYICIKKDLIELEYLFVTPGYLIFLNDHINRILWHQMYHLLYKLEIVFNYIIFLQYINTLHLKSFFNWNQSYGHIFFLFSKGTLFLPTVFSSVGHLLVLARAQNEISKKTELQKVFNLSLQPRHSCCMEIWISHHVLCV